MTPLRQSPVGVGADGTQGPASSLPTPVGRRDAVRHPLRLVDYSTTLEDGSRGYFARRPDDCWRATVATALRMQLHHVPDPHLDERLAAGEAPEDIDRSAQAEFARWLKGAGWRMVLHKRLPLTNERWIGVVPWPGWFRSHALVMTRDEVLHDASLWEREWDAAEGLTARNVVRWTVRNVKWGYSFRRDWSGVEAAQFPSKKRRA